MNPLTGLYASATGLRNRLFDRGILCARRLQRPVVSVGNLSAGGTGKTPFVIALGALLSRCGIRFDVLSRGYGRRTRGALVVEANGKAAEYGDEPLLMARELGVPVIVGESRYSAGRLAEENFESQVHILDDGFQHRSLARDFDIVLLTERDFGDRLLPSGRLREPLSSLRRADAIVLPEGTSPPERVREEFRQPGKFLWRMGRQLDVERPPEAPIVFCGIGRPGQFFEQLRGSGVTAAAEVEFRDHHAYAASDVKRLLGMRAALGAGGFLTTQKDAINLGRLQADLNPLCVARLRLSLRPEEEIIGAVLERIREAGGRS
jgi:tetraacyldisaccharide 4'-kinase